LARVPETSSLNPAEELKCRVPNGPDTTSLLPHGAYGAGWTPPEDPTRVRRGGNWKRFAPICRLTLWPQGCTPLVLINAVGRSTRPRLGRRRAVNRAQAADPTVPGSRPGRPTGRDRGGETYFSNPRRTQKRLGYRCPAEHEAASVASSTVRAVAVNTTEPMFGLWPWARLV